MPLVQRVVKKPFVRKTRKDLSWEEADQQLKKEATMAKKTKTAAKPKKLNAAQKQKQIDALQDKRDGVVIRSYERTLHALAGALGGSYAEESDRLKGELAPIETELAGLR